MTEQWLSIVEYARTFSISDMTVRRRIKTGKLRAVLKDGKYYIPVADGNRKNSAPFAREQEETYTQQPYTKQQSVPGPPPEMVVIKGHPTAERTYHEAMPRPPAHRPIQTPAVRREEIQTTPNSMAYTHIPGSLARAVQAEHLASVEAKALLAFCDAALKKSADAERRQSEKFKAKLMALESDVACKDLTVQKLQQQVEDLQLLVKILEKKK